MDLPTDKKLVYKANYVNCFSRSKFSKAKQRLLMTAFKNIKITL